MPQPDPNTEAWESYRLYQRDLLVGCFQDADLMLKRLKNTDQDDRRLVVSLLWEKRCQPWKFFRDDWVARPAARRQSKPSSS
ncbi:MAG: hypothetical protein ACYDDF_05235 [Thermoplasmatota archaeon]